MQLSIDISVVIVSWNAKEYLRSCLDSLIENQGTYSQEIIVVDNNSTDGSSEMVESIFPDVHLINNNNNLGFAAANNIGILASSGEYIAFINSDVMILDGCLQNLFNYMNEKHGIGLVGPQILNPDKSLQPSCRKYPCIWNNICQVFGFNHIFPNSVFFSDWFMNYWQHDTERNVDVLSGCFWMARRDVIDQVGLLDDNFFIYGEDIDWCRRFNQSGFEVTFCPLSQAIHYGGASSKNASVKFYIEMQKADLQYWKKYSGNSGRMAYWVISLLRHLVRAPLYAIEYLFHKKKRKMSILKLEKTIACVCYLFGFNVLK